MFPSIFFFPIDLVYSPDSGSPGPCSIDMSDTRLQPPCTSLPMALPTTGDLTQGCIRDYSTITTSPSYHHHPELFVVPSSSSLTPYSQAPLPYDTIMFPSEGNMGGYPHTYSADVQEHNSLDPIPIISCDQATGNPIRFYDCNTGDLSPRPPFVNSITSSNFPNGPNGPFHGIKSDPPTKGSYSNNDCV